LSINLENGNYLARGDGYDDVQHVWFTPIRFSYVQVERWFDFARTGAWVWFFSAGAAVGVLSGRLRLQNAQGCRASNWRHADTDPVCGGCYHDSDPMVRHVKSALDRRISPCCSGVRRYILKT
jgi:hypothetical protein